MCVLWMETQSPVCRGMNWKSPTPALVLTDATSNSGRCAEAVQHTASAPTSAEMSVAGERILRALYTGPIQFALGGATWSMTTTSTGLRAGSSLSPSCALRAVDKSGAESGPGFASSGVHFMEPGSTMPCPRPAVGNARTSRDPTRHDASFSLWPPFATVSR